MTPDLYHPVLDCFLRGLPYVYRDVDAPEGSIVQVEIFDECGGRWVLSRGANAWNFVNQPAGDFVARVAIPQALAWRIFTRGIDRDSALAQIEVAGNRDLAEKILNLTAIVG
jgi:hypothetical protein